MLRGVDLWVQRSVPATSHGPSPAQFLPCSPSAPHLQMHASTSSHGFYAPTMTITSIFKSQRTLTTALLMAARLPRHATTTTLSVTTFSSLSVHRD